VRVESKRSFNPPEENGNTRSLSLKAIPSKTQVPVKASWDICGLKLSSRSGEQNVPDSVMWGGAVSFGSAKQFINRFSIMWIFYEPERRPKETAFAELRRTLYEVFLLLVPWVGLLVLLNLK